MKKRLIVGALLLGILLLFVVGFAGDCGFMYPIQTP